MSCCDLRRVQRVRPVSSALSRGVWSLLLLLMALLPSLAWAAAPVASNNSVIVAYGSSNNAMPLSVSGGHDSVLILSPASHGLLTVSGATVYYTPTPGFGGLDSFSYTATNADGVSNPATVSITVAQPFISFGPGNPPDATRSQSYDYLLPSASGGTGPHTYSVTGGQLPPGISLDPNSGRLQGTPTATGTYSFSVRATDRSTGSGPYSSSSVSMTLTVRSVPGAPSITSVTPGDAAVEVMVAAPADDGGSPITTYTVTSNPGGITGTRMGGAGPVQVSGLTNGTSYTFTATATNGSGTGAASPASPSVTPQGYQTITFTNPGNVNFGTTTLLAATASSGLEVVFSSSTVNVCSVNGNQLTARAPGNCILNANQPGNPAFHPAPQVTQQFQVVVPGSAVSIITSTLPAATGGVAYNQPVIATGGAMPYTFQQVNGALPIGVMLTPDGRVTGVPRQSGTFPFTVRVTDQATQTADRNLTLQVIAPTITVLPVTLPGGIANQPYTQTITASGGRPGYTYAVTAGALPAGLVLSPAGVLSGTPVTAASSTFTVTATDDYGFTGTRAYTWVVGQPAPVAAADVVTVAANNAATLEVTGNDGGPFTSLAIAQAPAHGTATVSGLQILYTPASNYFGSDSLSYTVTGPGGTSAAATVSITVTPGAVPVVSSRNVTVQAGASITLEATEGATQGPFTAVNVVTPPSTGTLTVSGTTLVYAAAAESAGEVRFDYTLSNAFGTSAPATVTVQVTPRPVAASLQDTATPGGTVTVDLTAAATGGPFTRAAVVSVQPAGAGTATISGSGGQYLLNFAAASAFSGTATVAYTLSNAYSTSAPGEVRITVQGRSDPSKDAEVVGVLGAQADAARRLASGQMGNFQRRLEQLRSGSSASGFSNGITLSSASAQHARSEQSEPLFRKGIGAAEDADGVASSPSATPATPRALPGGIAVWTGGAVNFGKAGMQGTDDSTDFTTTGVSLGADKRLSEHLVLGAGVGYGHDDTDVGDAGSRSKVDGYTAAVYGSYMPGEAFFTDLLFGYQWLSMDSRRHVTDNGNTVFGSRDGTGWFGSLALGYQVQQGITRITPYGRLEMARASLDAFVERGDDIYALQYQRQTVNASRASAGVLAEFEFRRDYGVWAPQLRAEYGRDLEGSGDAWMTYADLVGGNAYRATLRQDRRDHALIGGGFNLRTLGGWTLSAEYQLQLQSELGDNQAVRVGIEKRFDP